MDLPYTNQDKYFTFNPYTFNKTDLESMKATIAKSNRRLVAIIDPHIKVDPNRYAVYDQGMEIDGDYDSYGNLISIFVKNDTNSKIPYVGWCWPGNS